MKRIPILSLILVLIITTAAIAQPGRRPAAPMGPGGPGGGEALAEFLQLSDAQKDAWKAAREEARETNKPLFEERRALQEQLHAALDGGSDAVAIGNLMLKIRATDEKIKAAHEALDAKLASALTAEQKVKFEAFQAAMKMLRHRPAPPSPPAGR